jgi:hypothetical protein
MAHILPSMPEGLPGHMPGTMPVRKPAQPHAGSGSENAGSNFYYQQYRENAG